MNNQTQKISKETFQRSTQELANDRKQERVERDNKMSNEKKADPGRAKRIVELLDQEAQDLESAVKKISKTGAEMGFDVSQSIKDIKEHIAAIEARKQELKRQLPDMDKSLQRSEQIQRKSGMSNKTEQKLDESLKKIFPKNESTQPATEDNIEQLHERIGQVQVQRKKEEHAIQTEQKDERAAEQEESISADQTTQRGVDIENWKDRKTLFKKKKEARLTSKENVIVSDDKLAQLKKQQSPNKDEEWVSSFDRDQTAINVGEDIHERPTVDTPLDENRKQAQQVQERVDQEEIIQGEPLTDEQEAAAVAQQTNELVEKERSGKETLEEPVQKAYEQEQTRESIGRKVFEQIEQSKMMNSIRDLGEQMQKRLAEGMTPLVHPQAIEFLMQTLDNYDELKQQETVQLQDVETALLGIAAVVRDLGEKQFQSQIPDTQASVHLLEGTLNLMTPTIRKATEWISLLGSEETKQIEQYLQYLQRLMQQKKELVVHTMKPE